jgi:5-methylcytosine-specific restriction enzyme subunit McrC
VTEKNEDQQPNLYMGSEKIRSGHLYQLYSYLSNIEYRGFPDTQTEGILLYPTINKSLNLNYEIKGHKIKIYTVDLNQEWAKIKSELMGLI